MPTKTNQPTETSLPPCEVFRTGTHTTSSGECLTYSAADLDAIANNYDPVGAPAPIVIGHPKADSPAYGWIKSFKRVGDKLVAEPQHVDAQFASLVKDKKFRKISMAFFRPNEASNPKPGIWYPRHWGFLGAAAPAVPGLQPVTWSGSDEGVVEFSMSSYQQANFFQRLRDFIIEKFSLEDADKVISDYQVASLFEDVGRESAADTASEFTATGAANGGLSSLSPADKNKPAPTLTTDYIIPNFSAQENTEMSEQDKQELERLRAENAKLQKDQQVAAREARRAEFAALTETLKAEGKLPAAEAAGAIEFALALTDDPAVEFAAADGKKVNSVAWFKSFLERLPIAIPLGELAKKPATDAAPPATFAAPVGAEVDAGRLELHNKAAAYAAQHKVDYFTAACAVGA
jgi:hypothetical protein